MSDTYRDKAERLGVPLIEKLSEPGVGGGDPNPITAICGQCGLEIRAVMFYSCGQYRCPVFLCSWSAGGAGGTGGSVGG